MEYGDITSMLKQIADLRTYNCFAEYNIGDQVTYEKGWQAALNAMEYWCQRNLEHRRGRG